MEKEYEGLDETENRIEEEGLHEHRTLRLPLCLMLSFPLSVLPRQLPPM